MSDAAWSRPALFLVDAVPESGDVVVDGPEGHHAAAVRRVRHGEVVLVGDGAGTVARAEVTAVTKGAVTASVLERRVVAGPQPRVAIAQALVKGDRGELAVELATEAGADVLIPWRAERCVARWEQGPRGDKALARWRTTAREAAKQARRAHAPVVTDPASTADLAARGSAAVLVLEATATTSLGAATLPDGGEVLLVVGPEGGITDAELATLTCAGGLAVHLGPTVVRTSTAAAVALGALGARTGRWG